jgi:hypothetical protein
LLSGRLVKLESQTPASAVRAEAAPCGGSQNLQIPVLNGARSAGFGTRTFAPPLSKPIIACELQNRKKPAATNRKRTTIFL